MSTKPETQESEEYTFTFETTGGLDRDVTVEAESREDALDTLADWNWYEVGVEDASGAHDHVTVAAPDKETAEERGVEKAERKGFNKIDNGSAYQASELGGIKELNDEWSDSRMEWGDDWTVSVEVAGVEAVGDRVASKVMDALVPYIAEAESAFEFEDRPDDPVRLTPEATRRAAWTAPSEFLGTETAVTLTLSGPSQLLAEEFDAVVARVEATYAEVSAEWSRVQDAEYLYGSGWGPHSVPEHVENPHGEGVTFWADDGRGFVFGHELTVEHAESGMELDYVWVESGQALAFQCSDADRCLTVHPYKSKPEAWEVFGGGGVKADYEGRVEQGVYEWTVGDDGESEERYRVCAPTLDGEVSA